MSAIGLLVAFVLVAYLAIGSAESADALAPSAEVFPITFWAMHYALYYWDFRGDYSEILSDEQYRLMKECNVYCWKGRKKEELGRFPSDRFVRGADGGLVSCAEFDGNAGAKYLVIVNRNVNEPITIAPKLRWEQVAEIAVFDRARGAWPDTPAWRVGDEPLRLELAPGDGTFLRCIIR